MAEIHPIAIKDGDVLLLVGTTKGAFLLRSNGARAKWEVGGPHFLGQSIYTLAFDPRGGRRRLLAGGGSDHWGPVFHTSDDDGRTWMNHDKSDLRFPEGLDASVKRIWQIRAGTGDPRLLYAGVEPAALFVSRDGGESWSLVRGLWDHPHRPQWQAGGGGLCLHTVLPDPVNPDRVTVAISTGGVYRTDDGGATWAAKNRGVRAQFLPDPHPEFGQCVHKIVHHPSRPERLFLQNHWGLYRSDDAGDSWTDIARGVPSDFGFCMAMHAHDAETVFIVPIESDMFRCTPEGKLRVYRTRDAGESWEPLTRGLPQKNALETVLRDAMDVDRLNPAGVYFGTRSGTVYGSPDGGASWSVVTSGLPPVLCVRAVVVGDPAQVRVPRPASAARKRAPAPAAWKTPKRKAAAEKSAKKKPAAGRPVTKKPAPRKALSRKAPSRKAVPSRKRATRPAKRR